MIDETDDRAVASRRDLVAGAVALAAAAGAAGSAQAQTSDPHLRFLNPAGISAPRGYTHVVEVAGPGRTVYIAGQIGIDPTGKVPGDFRAQAAQVFENLKVALAAVGGKFEHVVKLNNYLTDIAAQIGTFREVRDRYVNTASPPASTTIQVPALARPGLLIEVEAVAVLPAPSVHRL